MSCRETILRRWSAFSILVIGSNQRKMNFAEKRRSGQL
jgi:hypothetical protein